MGYNKAEEGLSAIQTFLVCFSYAMLIFCGIWREIVDKFFGIFNSKQSYKVKGYAPLMVEYDRFFVTRMYQPVGDSFDRPITGTPGTFMEVLERSGLNGNSSYSFTGNKMKCLNLGSYNYLGFALNSGSVLEDSVSVVEKYNVSNCGSILEGGYTQVHKELEESIAEFVGKESAIIFEMGYATNSTTIPALVKKGALVVSDSLNHASLVMGLRASGAHVAVFNHNDTMDLERVIRKSISKGQPFTGEPYSMILIVVEGIYSMEGIICQLPEIVRIKKKYKAYLYVDEAHSIGALGKRGRGVCDYFNVNPNDVDILMGTFTKSFASIGGYVAGSKDLITRLRASSFGITYANSMSVVCAQQSLSALRVITGKDGTDIGAKRLLQLKENCNYFRSRLRQMGFLILGNNDSPIIPLMLYYPGKVSYFSRQLLARGVAVVVVGYPATPLLTARARFCISAGHTKEDLEYALKAIEDVGTQCGINY